MAMTLGKPLVDAVTAPPRAPKDNKKAEHQLPKPPFQLVQDRYLDDGPPRLNAWKFFDYWKKLPAPLAELVEVRAYCCWPEINIYQTDPGAKNKVFRFLHGAVPFQDPRAYIKWFLENWGAGDWKLILQEAGVSGKIMSCFFKARSLVNPGTADFESLDKFPPQIDVGMLKRETINEVYIQWLKRKGTELPWEETEDEAMGMSNGPAHASVQQPVTASSAIGEAFRTMAESHVAIARQAVEGAEKLADARIKSAEHRGPDPMLFAQQESIRLVTSTSDKMIDMVTKHAGKQYDPMDMMERAAKIIRPDKKPGETEEAGGNTLMQLVLNTIEKSNDRVLSLYEKQAEMLQRSIELRANGDGSHGPGIAGAVVPAKGFVEQAEEYKRIADIFGWNRGGARSQSTGDHDSAPAAPAAPSWFNETTAPIIVMGFQTIMVLGANLMYNWAATKIKDMVPQQPGAAVAEAQRMMNQQQPGAAGQTATDTGADPAADQAARERASWAKFIVDLEGPFLAHFFTEDARGYTLAHYVQSDGTMKDFTTNGRSNYMAICRLGKTKEEQRANPAAPAPVPQCVAAFKQLCAGNHSLWSKIQGRPQAVDRFILEFITYDKWAAEEAERQRRTGQPAAATVEETVD